MAPQDFAALFKLIEDTTDDDNAGQAAAAVACLMFLANCHPDPQQRSYFKTRSALTKNTKDAVAHIANFQKLGDDPAMVVAAPGFEKAESNLMQILSRYDQLIKAAKEGSVSQGFSAVQMQQAEELQKTAFDIVTKVAKVQLEEAESQCKEAFLALSPLSHGTGTDKPWYDGVKD